MQTQKNELNFNGHNIYVGMDVHLKSWTVCIMTEHLEHKQFTQPPNAAALHNYLVRNFPGATYYTVYESGFSGFWAHRQLEALGIHSIVTNAADVPTGQKEKLNKTDPVDSRKLARSLRSKELDAIYTPTDSTLQERNLLRVRNTLVKELCRFKQRIKSLLYFYGIKALSIKEKYAVNVNLLKTIPGIGLITAMTLLTEIETIERFEDTDHFAGYVGLVPIRSSSGEVTKDGEMTFRGHDRLKKCLMESSWVAARADPALSLAYNKLAFRMEPNKAIVRIARKLLNRIYYVLKKQEKYVKGMVK